MIKRWASLLVLPLVLAASVSRGSPLAQKSFCEFSSLPPNQLIDRVAESYRGLLEFGGELFTDAKLAALLSDQVSLEKYFEGVPLGDQRSASLNESMKKLGDWVTAEAEQHEVSLAELKSRLKQEVVARLQSSRDATAQAQETRAEQRLIGDVHVEFSPHVGDVWAPVFVGTGDRLLSVGRDRLIRLWSLEREVSGLSLEFEREFPSELGNYLTRPQAYALQSPDRVLLAYLSSSFLEVWDWRLRQRVRLLRAEADELTLTPSISSVSPTGRFFLGTTKAGALIVADLETGVFSDVVQEAYGQPKVAAWSLDGSRFAAVFERGKAFFVVVFAVSGAFREVKLEKIFWAPASEMPLELFFGADNQTLIFANLSGLKEFRLNGHELVERSASRRRGGATQRALDRGRGWVLEPDAQDVKILSLANLSDLGKLSGPMEKHRNVLRLKLSPSGRYVAVGYQDCKTIWVWDLNTRRVAVKLAFRFHQLIDPFEFSMDDRRLLIRGHEKARIYSVEGLVTL